MPAGQRSRVHPVLLSLSFVMWRAGWEDKHRAACKTLFSDLYNGLRPINSSELTNTSPGEIAKRVCKMLSRRGRRCEHPSARTSWKVSVFRDRGCLRIRTSERIHEARVSVFTGHRDGRLWVRTSAWTEVNGLMHRGCAPRAANRRTSERTYGPRGRKGSAPTTWSIGRTVSRNANA